MQILKMAILENFLLEPMKFLYQNEDRVTCYSSTSELESNGTKSGTILCGHCKGASHMGTVPTW